jgi:phage tail sheath gpL-like
LEGYTFAAASDTVSNLVTLGSARNKQYVSIFDAGYNSPKPAYLQAAELCGQASYAASIDPARPFNTLTLIGNLAEPDEDRRSLTENNTLLYSGIATRNIANDGAVQIGRLISTYQKNPAGQADASWLDANVALTLSDHRQSWRARIRLKYPRHKLGNSGQRFGLGQQIVTPDVIRGEAIAWYGERIAMGLAEDMDTFVAESIFVRPTSDKNRVDSVLAVTLLGQFHILATQIAFS